ncbi:hypothetical protein SAMN04488512_102325 [Sulfitobacter litoralis]|uniref:Uncharacterized protein n=1 Tax=Sulfitobacter litoralis TaxID=335975 RepID=A0ABY0RRU9_9RHOB|nr:hypothetical protein [Sulfitobacter litoralis]SDO40635.1 hypothetical protein SAMN04488512_102325 [Sulfitobacter litoralis]
MSEDSFEQQFRRWDADIQNEGRTNEFVRAGRLYVAAFLKDIGWPHAAGRQRLKENHGLLKARAEWEAKHCTSQDRPSAALDRLNKLISEHDFSKTLLPTKYGALWHAQIAEQAGLTAKQMERKDVRALLSSYAALNCVEFSRRGSVAPEEDIPTQLEISDELVPKKRLREVQTQLAKAERKLAELRAENASLRAQSIRRDEISDLIALGGRYSTGPQN